MRFYCDIEGLEQNWIDVSERWTRKEYLALQDSKPDEFLPSLIGKITALHLEDMDGNVIEKPDDLTDENLDNMDVRLLGFVGGISANTFIRLRTLGNAHARLSSERSETKAELPLKS